MKQSVKFIILLVVLGIPALIFTFLKNFGDNRFEVEIMHQDGVSDSNLDCNFMEGQFYVPDSILKTSPRNKVVTFVNKTGENDFRNISVRISELFGKNIEMMLFSTQQIDSNDNQFETRVVNNIDLIANCGFVSNELNQLILVDTENRIRGYYDRDIDEIDRLIVEIKILIENAERVE